MLQKDKYDDGFAPQLVECAAFDHGMPCIEPLPKTVPMPKRLVSFNKRNQTKDRHAFIDFYASDRTFSQLARRIDQYIPALAEFDGVISPDYSLYWRAPLPVGMANTYGSRAIGHYLQRQGIPVIPNVRWGDESTFDYCFRGIEPDSMVAIGSVGCMRSRSSQQMFAMGLAEMFRQIHPSRVVLYGPNPAQVFGPYWNRSEFRTFPCHTHVAKEASHGQR